MRNAIFDISGKVAIVTGGTGVLGGSIAESFLTAGAKVAIIARNEENVSKKTGFFRKNFGERKVLGYSCNVLDMGRLKIVKRDILEKWKKENCTVLTSEGRSRIDADGSNARWCIVEGESGTWKGRSGILFLSHPSNRAHPEPMRVWPPDGNGGRGDMFFEFTPIRHKSWELKRGNQYALKYRMIVFDGNIDTRTADMYRNSFSGMPEIEVESIK